MASNPTTCDPDHNGGDDNIQQESPDLTALAHDAMVMVHPGTARIADSTRETVGPTVEETAAESTGDNTTGDSTSDNTVTATNPGANPVIVNNTVTITVSNIGNAVNTGEAVPSACSHASASANEQKYQPSASSTVSRTVNLHAPYAPGAPDPVLTQIWIEHIDHMLGVRTERQIEGIQRCIEQTDRVVNLSNSILACATEMLAEVRRINREQYDTDYSDHDSSSTSGEPTDCTD
ncbi:hypothetical protein N7447_009264 [Penicillium robsamsonii]|uniref:uncharacterized protein n=1 Tax=Penicillium robsamsonii TaxID=1792511 RepID=UPI0025475EFF|nr:uncharacterized protein N7447_009264 [Penicillium robsamsonii]KAJ5817031.1 hypothetical protein N7447_009264 [Penicillium robsamsonii]